MEKYKSAVMLGYRVLRFTPEMVKSGVAIETVNNVMKAGEAIMLVRDLLKENVVE